MAGVVAKNYCDAIVGIAMEDDMLDLYKTQLLLVDATMQSTDSYALMGHPNVTHEAKKKILEEIYGAQIDHTLLNFLKLLIDKNHFCLVHAVVKEYIRQYNAIRHIQVVYVHSARAIPAKQAQRLKKTLEEQVHKTIDMRVTIDEELIAGIRVKIDDFIIDNSVRSRLQRMQRNIIANKQ